MNRSPFRPIGNRIRTLEQQPHPVKCNFDATIAPAVTDDLDLGYAVGSEWVDVVVDKVYVCVDEAVGAAIWIEICCGGGGGPLALDDLTDVNAPAPNDNDVLTWDSGTSKWIAAASAGGAVDASIVTYTPAVVTDWDGNVDPGNADDAFDQLAERVDDLEGVTLPNHDHSGDAGDGGTFDAANLTSGASGDGDVLTSDGAGGAAWEVPTGGASAVVLQILSTTKTDTFTSAVDETWTDITGLSISITPGSTSNKILIMTSVVGVIYRPGQNAVHLRLIRDATPIAIGDAMGNRTRATMSSAKVSDDSVQTATMNFLDSPASVAAVTYKVQFWQDTPGSPLYINRNVTDANSAYVGRYVSSITVMEVAG